MANSDHPDRLSWSFKWDRGQGEVTALGGMLAPVTFELANGRRVQPLAVAPWGDDTSTDHASLPGILRRLRGDWPCVPFGMPETRTDLPERWLNGLQRYQDNEDAHPHGYGSNHHWYLVEKLEHGLRVAIDYPENHPVEKLEQVIRGRAGAAAVELTLIVHVRRDTKLPMGLHPVFSLPSATGSAQLDLPRLTSIHSYPVEVEPGVSMLWPDQTATHLDELFTKNGKNLDLSHLPLLSTTEELVLARVASGLATLSRPDLGYSSELRWNADQFPFCLLWISNRGRSAYPWNGRHISVGIEPVAAAFDLGVTHSRNDSNPLSRFGKTYLQLKKDKPFTSHHSITVHPL